MVNEQKKFFIWALGFIAFVWIAAFVGFKIVEVHKVTPAKVAHYIINTDLTKLSPQERKRALDKLADMMNSLQYEDRRKMRLENEWRRLFEQMTDKEKEDFIEKTLPVGFKRMLDSFEKLPEERRKKIINDSLRRLKEAQETMAAENPRDKFARQNWGTNAPVISPELEQKVRVLGLKTFYNESSAQTKAELAPVLEEIHRLMERGSGLR